MKNGQELQQSLINDVKNPYEFETIVNQLESYFQDKVNNTLKRKEHKFEFTWGKNVITVNWNDHIISNLALQEIEEVRNKTWNILGHIL